MISRGRRRGSRFQQQLLKYLLRARGGLLQRLFKLGRRQAQHRCYRRAAGGLGGKPMGLRVFAILQCMFNLPQQRVGAGQCIGIGPCQMFAPRQCLQACKCRPAAQRRIATTANNLKKLGDEFDLANTATAQLDVVATVATGVFAVNFGTNPRVQFAQRIERAKIKVTPKDKGLHDCDQRLFVAAGRLCGRQHRVGDHM